MKQAKNFVLMGCLAGMTAGCASGVKYSEYRNSVVPPPDGYGRVWFYRPSAMGTAVQPNIKLDNKVVGSAVPHGFFHIETEPGEHEVSARTEWKHKRVIAVTANQDTFVRLNMAMGVFVGHVIPEAMPESKATNQMKNLRFVSKETKK